MFRKIAAAALIAVTLGGCASLGEKINLATGIYQKVTETTVPAEAVIPVAYSFGILKNAATNYGRYCIREKMAPAICEAGTRRTVIKSVRAGTAARNQLEASLESGQPALGSIYNVLVSAVQGLQNSPAASATFVEAK